MTADAQSWNQGEGGGKAKQHNCMMKRSLLYAIAIERSLDTQGKD
jgi:hypothetical protein